MNKVFSLMLLVAFVAAVMIPTPAAAIAYSVNCEEAFYDGFDAPYGPDCLEDIVNAMGGWDGWDGGGGDTW